MKNVSDFNLRQDWFEVGLGLVLVLCLFGMILSMVNESAYWAVIIYTSAFLAAILGAKWDKRQSAKAESAFNAWLATFELPSLLKLRESEEIDVPSRLVITQYLNVNHEGWSVSG